MGLSNEPSSGNAKSGSANEVTAESIKPPAQIQTALWVHFAPVPKGDPSAIASELLRTRHRYFEQVSGDKKPPRKAVMFVRPIKIGVRGASVPSLETLQYYSSGVSAEQAQALQNSKTAIVLGFSYSSATALEANHHACSLAADLAKETDGLIWDEETRELFSHEAWTTKRLRSPDNGFPSIVDHITIHAYRQEYVRAVTLGMRKFGLPDLVIDESSWSVGRPVGKVINALAQTMLEGGTVPACGKFELNIANLKHAALRKKYEDNLLEGGKGVGTLTLRTVKPDEGDADNQLIKITFDEYDGSGAQEKQHDFFDEMFGAVDSTTQVKHDEAVRAASNRARQEFETLREQFDAGLAPDSRLLVKAPFKTSRGGNEWMWVEVIKWKGGDIGGLLQNVPVDVPGLKPGARVRIRQSSMLDYKYYKSDGTTEGNETAELLKRPQPNKSKSERTPPKKTR
jgi:uncharacterized protein YegJ (DUF2314 family)